MNIEIWSDIACPFCWIGKRNFEAAVNKLQISDFEVTFRSFELDPYAQASYDDDLLTLLANKYGQTKDWAIQMTFDMRERGLELGLEFNFDQVVSTNTFDAHRFVHFAKEKNKQGMAVEQLFCAYFRDGEKVSDKTTLVNLAAKIGLERKEAAEVLDSDHFETDVRQDEQLAQQFGIRSVPYFVIDRKYGISGAQPIPHFVQALANINQKRAQEDT